ncbi:MAG: DUF2125 domain-containing protein [Rhodovarius sp.]|nr:DUF2125 domain-containing protein [Rhodovarius sp.]
MPRPIRLLLLAASALLLLQTALWWAAGLLLQGRAAAWVELRRAEAWQISHGPPRRSGWPFAVRLDLPGMEVEGPGLAWRAEGLSLRWNPLAPRQLIAEPWGEQRLIAGPFALPYRAELARALLPLRAAAGAEARLEMAGITAPGLRIASGRARLTPDAAGIEVALTLEGLDLARPPPGPLGPRIARLSLEGSLSGPLPAAGGATRLAAWREAGGAVVLRELRIEWGAMSASLTGRAGLDAGLRPAGEGVLVISGAQAGLETLAAAGLLPPAAVGAARLLLGVMARPEPGSGVLRLPVAAREGRLFLAGLPLLPLPPLAAP